MQLIAMLCLSFHASQWALCIYLQHMTHINTDKREREIDPFLSKMHLKIIQSEPDLNLKLYQQKKKPVPDPENNPGFVSYAEFYLDRGRCFTAKRRHKYDLLPVCIYTLTTSVLE